jgi:hypothetical protein
MEKDNVLVEEQLKTEREEKDGEVLAKEKNGSAVLKKFKDENALSQAYGALEAEFTRRSQRLKALEREFAKLQAEKLEKDGEVKENLDADEEIPSQTKDAIVEPENESFVGDESEKKEGLRGELERSSLDGAKTFESIAKSSNEQGIAHTISDEEIYSRASQNEEIRLKIIGDYFASLKKSDAPLLRGGQGTISTPSSKASSLSQAANMALRYFKSETNQSNNLREKTFEN